MLLQWMNVTLKMFLFVRSNWLFQRFLPLLGFCFYLIKFPDETMDYWENFTDKLLALPPSELLPEYQLLICKSGQFFSSVQWWSWSSLTGHWELQDSWAQLVTLRADSKQDIEPTVVSYLTDKGLGREDWRPILGIINKNVFQTLSRSAVGGPCQHPSRNNT